MKRTMSTVLVAMLVPLAAVSSTDAQTILQPTGISSPQGSFGGVFGLEKIIDQSGLVPGYISGVTDFDVYTASAVHNSVFISSFNSGYTNSDAGFPQIFTFDLALPRLSMPSHSGMLMHSIV